VNDAKLMHLGKAVESLLNVTFQFSDRQIGLSFLDVLENMLQGLVAEFKHWVLDEAMLRICSVEEVEHLNDILFSFQGIKNLKLSGNSVANFLWSLYGYKLIGGTVDCLENVSYTL